MGDSDKGAVDRREFLKGIAAGAAGATQVTVHTSGSRPQAPGCPFGSHAQGQGARIVVG